MNRIRAISAVVVFLLIFCCDRGYSQGSSNQGKEFWTAFMAHNLDAGSGGSRMALYITSDFNTEGKVEIADGSYSSTFKVKAREVTIVDIPPGAFLKTSGQFLKGIHITAQKRIAVYAHIFAQSVSGATLLLPVNVLGKSYYSINYTQQANTSPTYSTFMVIATEDNTTVEITPSTALINKPAGVPFTVTLKKGELYQGFADADLTKTTIRSISSANGECKKIAVFSGSTRLSIGCDPSNRDFSSDNLFQQSYPTSSWGKNYVTVPLKNRSYDIFRVMLSDVNTDIKINGKLISKDMFADPQYYEFASDSANFITANKPIQVVQYAVTQYRTNSQDCIRKTDDLGDPEMIYLSPLEQTLDHVTLYSAGNYRIIDHYINIIIKTSAIGSFMLDGKTYVNEFRPLSYDPVYSYAQLTVNVGTHYINAGEGFNAIAYGFGSAESYGYAAGANLKNLNENIVFIDPQNSSKVQISGCAGVEYKLQLTLPYQTSNIKWTLNDGSEPFVDNSPVVKSTFKRDSTTLYTYEYQKLVKYATGDYTITATVINPVADECGSTSDIDFDVSIADYPVSKFSFTGTCPGDTTYFSDTTDVTNNVIKNRHWDFGDGQTSIEENPKHLYASQGTYNVTLINENENGCASSITKTIRILNRPVAAFDFKSVACIGMPVSIADRSTSADGAIKQWIYDFKDGTVETRTDNAPFTHTYLDTGTYRIQLTVVNQNGCSATFENVITVNVLPVVDFTVPDICIADAFAQFFDKSIIGDNAEQFFNYSWDFGDSKANAANPNTSTDKNPRHKYTQAGVYTVKLTVTSGNGCPQTKSIEFTVNGSTPKAIFTVENAASLCSANDVLIQDKSTVDFGNITKVQLYYDFDNHPEVFEEFDRTTMPADGIYHHLYPLSATTANYKIRMQVFSGGVCASFTEQDIVVKGNPQVTLRPTAPLCEGDTPVQIVVNNNGFAGNGIFTGKGVSTTGLFNPAVAGPGLHTITYQFIADTGCDVTAMQNITVNALPTADAGADVIMLQGGFVTLKATATGTGLTYKWTPSTGLDHDDILDPVISPQTDITYKLTVTNLTGCVATDEIFITVLKNPIVVNTFTPNGDGVNDVWNIKYLENYPGCTIDIYNRQGEKVYSSVGYAVPWDGKYKGAVLPAGAYYYIINPKNRRKVISGNVTIIR